MSDDIHLLMTSLQLLSHEQSEQWQAATYARFFEQCPEGPHLWGKDDPASRAKMFNAVILAIIDNLARPDTGARNLQADLHTHQGYGVNPAMYALFLEALQVTLADTLGEAMTPEMTQAWARQTGRMCRMIDQQLAASGGDAPRTN